MCFGIAKGRHEQKVNGVTIDGTTTAVIGAMPTSSVSKAFGAPAKQPCSTAPCKGGTIRSPANGEQGRRSVAVFVRGGVWQCL